MTTRSFLKVVPTNTIKAGTTARPRFMAVDVDPQPLNLVIPVGNSRRMQQALCEPWTSIPVIEGRLKNKIIDEPDAPLANLINEGQVMLPLQPQTVEPESRLARDPDLLKLLYLAYYYRDCILEGREPVGQPSSAQCESYYHEWLITEKQYCCHIADRADAIERACRQPVVSPSLACRLL